MDQGWHQVLVWLPFFHFNLFFHYFFFFETLLLHAPISLLMLLMKSAGARKQLGGPSILGDSTLHQPMGLPLAATASSLMAGALGGAQTSGVQNGLQSQSGIGNDPLTHYLAGMSRHQLNEIMSEIKVIFSVLSPFFCHRSLSHL